MNIEIFFKRVVALHDKYFSISNCNLDSGSLYYEIPELIGVFISLPPVLEANEMILVESTRFYLQELLLKSKGLL